MTAAWNFHSDSCLLSPVSLPPAFPPDAQAAEHYERGHGDQQIENHRHLCGLQVDAGMTAETLKPGDRVAVSGNPVRSKGGQSLYIRKLERLTDGFVYEQVGRSPQIRGGR